jgi:hypothetical protein
VVHWANGGETKLANLVTVCVFHHRLVHEGGYGVHRADNGEFVFTRPDGSRVEPNGNHVSTPCEYGVGQHASPPRYRSELMIVARQS